MTQDPLTLYKLIVLYMLNKVNFPLTKSQICDFILEKEYTNFLSLQQAISELLDAGLINQKSLRNRTHLQITEEGINTLEFFGNRIGSAITDEIDSYMNTHKFELKNEVSVTGTYYKSTAGDYEVSLVATEKKKELIHLTMSVPSTDIAVSICENWEKKNQSIYQYLTEQLF